MNWRRGKEVIWYVGCSRLGTDKTNENVGIVDSHRLYNPWVMLANLPNTYYYWVVRTLSFVLVFPVSGIQGTEPTHRPWDCLVFVKPDVTKRTQTWGRSGRNHVTKQTEIWGSMCKCTQCDWERKKVGRRSDHRNQEIMSLCFPPGLSSTQRGILCLDWPLPLTGFSVRKPRCRTRLISRLITTNQLPFLLAYPCCHPTLIKGFLSQDRYRCTVFFDESPSRFWLWVPLFSLSLSLSKVYSLPGLVAQEDPTVPCPTLDTPKYDGNLPEVVPRQLPSDE